MTRSALPPAPLDREERVIEIPAHKFSTSQRNFIKAAVKYSKKHYDRHLDAILKQWQKDGALDDVD